MRPTVTIEVPDPLLPFRGDTVTYRVTPLDPDGDSTTVAWATTPEMCPNNFKLPESWPPTWKSTEVKAGSAEVKVAKPVTMSPYCLWVKVTDRYGAVDVSTRPENPADHVPVVSVQVSSNTEAKRRPDGTFPLRTPFVISGAGTTDADEGDPRNFKEFLLRQRPPGSQAVMADCPEFPDPALSCFTADVLGEYVVELKFSDYEDGRNEVSGTSSTLKVTAGPAPKAKLRVLSPSMTVEPPAGQATAAANIPKFPLGSEFKISAMDSTDPEPLDPLGPMFMWHLSPAAGSASTDHPCSDNMSTMFRCFTGDVQGVYQLSVNLLDGPLMSTDDVFVEVLPDALPCLGETEPKRKDELVGASVESGRIFTVMGVDDDLDRYPPRTSFKNAARFDWFVGNSSGVFRLAQTGPSPEFQLTTSTAAFGFRLGDEALVRLQIRDRDTDRSQLEFETCGNADTCPTAESKCYRRWTWKAKFNQ
jgi:hypothetical protein